MNYWLDTQVTFPLPVEYTGTGKMSKVTKYLTKVVLATLNSQATAAWDLLSPKLQNFWLIEDMLFYFHLNNWGEKCAKFTN